MEHEDTEQQSKSRIAIAQRAGFAIGNPVKALGRNRVGEYGVLWGSPEQRDLYDEYFDAQTEELDAIFRAMGVLPTLYHHAMDGTLRSAVVGRIDVMQPDDVGLWVEAQLDISNEYSQAIQRLVSEGKLHWSSGTLPGARKVAPDGRIERWSCCEFSLTPSPAEFRMLARPITEVKSHFAEIGLMFEPETEAKGAEDARLQVTAKLRLLDLLSLETAV